MPLLKQCHKNPINTIGHKIHSKDKTILSVWLIQSKIVGIH